MEEKLIYASTNNLEVDYICSVLKENGIIFTKNTEGAGDYLKIATGNLFNYITKIYVSEKEFEKASELIKNISFEKENIQNFEIPDELKNISDEEENELDKKAKKTRKSLKLFIILFVFCPIVIAIVTAIITQSYF